MPEIPQLTTHPLAEIYPPMTEDEYQGFKADIAANGLQQALTLLDGMILDGRNRYRAVGELAVEGHGAELKTEVFTGADPLAFVHSANFHRRHLNVSQKAAIGVDCKEHVQEQIIMGGDRRSEDFQGGNISTLNGKARDIAADMVGVSGRTIDAAARVKREDPETFEAMKAGEVSVWEANRQLDAAQVDNTDEQSITAPDDTDLQTLIEAELEDADPYTPPEELPDIADNRLAPLMTSNSFEWYTPAHIIERVRVLMSHIDLDPCSSEAANQVIRAAGYYTATDDGLRQEWQGRVYMNPPYGSAIGEWVVKLAASFCTGAVTQAVVLLPARTDTAWFRRLREFPRCFLYGRLQFDGPGSNGNSATFPSVAVALGFTAAELADAFEGLGDTYEFVIGDENEELSRRPGDE